MLEVEKVWTAFGQSKDILGRAAAEDLAAANLIIGCSSE
jgi:hypothetical protein